MRRDGITWWFGAIVVVVVLAANVAIFVGTIVVAVLVLQAMNVL